MKRITILIMILAVFLLLLEFTVIRNENKAPQSVLTPVFTGVPARDLWVELPEVDRPKLEMCKSEQHFVPFVLTYERMELTSLGTYYITSYCPSECGYNGSNYPSGWVTASDTICHRADYHYRLSEPTTCAISRSVHSFGDTFYIPEFDRTFVAEDTGSAVKGKHLDLFYEEYSDVCSFPTGYYEVYAVTWVEETVIVYEEDLKHLADKGALEYYEY